MKSKKRIKEIFKKLKVGHPLWVRGDNVYKARLEKAFEPFFVELEQLGVLRHFSEALLFFGREFIDSLGKVEEIGWVRKNELAIVKDVELIFGVKATKMSKTAINEAKLAKKHNALVYNSIPMKGDRVSIRVLTYKQK